jgi:hypothetical protein
MNAASTAKMIQCRLQIRSPGSPCLYPCSDKGTFTRAYMVGSKLVHRDHRGPLPESNSADRHKLLTVDEWGVHGVLSSHFTLSDETVVQHCRAATKVGRLIYCCSWSSAAPPIKTAKTNTKIGKNSWTDRHRIDVKTYLHRRPKISMPTCFSYVCGRNQGNQGT